MMVKLNWLALTHQVVKKGCRYIVLSPVSWLSVGSNFSKRSSSGFTLLLLLEAVALSTTNIQYHWTLGHWFSCLTWSFAFRDLVKLIYDECCWFYVRKSKYIFMSEKANTFSTSDYHHVREWQCRPPPQNTTMLAFFETANLTSTSY